MAWQAGTTTVTIDGVTHELTAPIKVNPEALISVSGYAPALWIEATDPNGYTQRERVAWSTPHPQAPSAEEDR